MDRYNALTLWAAKTLADNNCTIEAASSDASFRSYWRIFSQGKTYIVMDAPPEHEDCLPFIKISKLLSATGVFVPKVLAHDLKQGFLLLTDLGSVQYLSVLNSDTFSYLYGDAIHALHKIQSHANSHDLPKYDAMLLNQEVHLFDEWFIAKHLDKVLSKKQHLVLSRCYKTLIDNALEQPQTFVHRDYHSRNLMQTENNNPGILDYQDAVFGPVTYDLVSLLRDCYIAWDDSIIYPMVDDFRNKYNNTFHTEYSQQHWFKWFDLMGIQRHLKAIGIFCRLNYRDNKPNYLKDINRTFCYVKHVSKKYPELHSFYELIVDITPSMDTICAQ
jgi:hypothetical protein